MIRKSLLFLCFITTTHLFPAAPYRNQSTQHLTHFASTSPQANQALYALNQLPEFRELLVKVQQEGPVHLRVKSADSFDGLWESVSRTIVVNTRSNPTHGSMICTILFELHNAATTRYYDELIDQVKAGRLTKDEYVEKVEYAEYKNARNTRLLIEKGIEMGIFPRDAHWPIPPTFEEHYKVQQICGHSDYIAKNYDYFNPRGRHIRYQGTIRCPAQMTEKDKNEMCRFIAMRAAMESDDDQAQLLSTNDFNEEISSIRLCHERRAPSQEMARNLRRTELFKSAFVGNTDYAEACRKLSFLG